jgi:hypothetical protein
MNVACIFGWSGYSYALTASTSVVRCISYREETDCQRLITMTQVHDEVRRRMGLVPNFFLLAPNNPEITENLWGFTRFGYLDNPLPSLFKERLFVWLSRFCEARCCICAMSAFLSASAGSPVTPIAARSRSMTCCACCNDLCRVRQRYSRISSLAPPWPNPSRHFRRPTRNLSGLSLPAPRMYSCRPRPNPIVLRAQSRPRRIADGAAARVPRLRAYRTGVEQGPS